MSGIYIECDICGELYGSDSTGYLTDTWIRDGHECVTHCKDCNPHATEQEALRERIAQAIYKATGEVTLITTMDAIMDVIAKADGGGAEVKPGFTLEDAGPAHDTPKRRGTRTIYVDGPNGKGDNGSHIEVFGPDRDAFASLLLSMFGAEEVKPETEAERLERFKRSIGLARGDNG